ncbi:MAG: hypothetical protein RL069_1540, partial [Planctomycetota bacterium]
MLICKLQLEWRIDQRILLVRIRGEIIGERNGF